MAEDTASTDTPATEPTVVNYSKPTQDIHIPKVMPQDVSTYHDLHEKSRTQRLRSIMADLGDMEEKEIAQKILGSTKRESAKEEDTKVEQEPEAESEEAAAKAISPEDDEKRKEDRRKAVEADEKEKLGLKTEDKPEDTPEKKDDATKLEKERRAKFEKVLAMEAKAQKERDRLRNLESRLAQREQEISNNVKRAQAQLDEQARQYDRQVRTAENILRLARENPLELLEQAGARPEDVAGWIAAASDPTNQKLKEMERRMAAKEAQERELQRQLQAQRAQQHQQETMRQVEQQYLSQYDEKDDKGDSVFDAALTVYSQRELVNIGHEIANEAVKKGYSFTYRDIAEAVNALAQEDTRYRKIQERLSKVSAPPSKAKEEVTTAKAESSPVKATATKTTTILTNNAAQQPSSAASKRPDPSYKRKREERNKRLFAGLDSE